MSFVSINSINLNFNAKICPTLAAMAALPWCFYVQMMPTLLARTNRDVVAIAEHGCGKTLAYAVPLLIRAAALQGQHKNTLQMKIACHAAFQTSYSTSRHTVLCKPLCADVSSSFLCFGSLL